MLARGLFGQKGVQIGQILAQEASDAHLMDGFKDGINEGCGALLIAFSLRLDEGLLRMIEDTLLPMLANSQKEALLAFKKLIKGRFGNTGVRRQRIQRRFAYACGERMTKRAVKELLPNLVALRACKGQSHV